MTAELVGMRERSVGPAGTMCCKTDRLVVEEALTAAADTIFLVVLVETDGLTDVRLAATIGSSCRNSLSIMSDGIGTTSGGGGGRRGSGVVEGNVGEAGKVVALVALDDLAAAKTAATTGPGDSSWALMVAVTIRLVGISCVCLKVTETCCDSCGLLAKLLSWTSFFDRLVRLLLLMLDELVLLLDVLLLLLLLLGIGSRDCCCNCRSTWCKLSMICFVLRFRSEWISERARS